MPEISYGIIGFPTFSFTSDDFHAAYDPDGFSLGRLAFDAVQNFSSSLHVRQRERTSLRIGHFGLSAATRHLGRSARPSWAASNGSSAQRAPFANSVIRQDLPQLFAAVPPAGADVRRKCSLQSGLNGRDAYKAAIHRLASDGGFLNLAR